MEIERVLYRRADINDIDDLCDYRIQFLNDLFDHPFGKETGTLREQMREYLLQAIPSNTFIAWLAEYEGKLIATSGMVIYRILPRYDVITGKIGYILNMYTIPEARKKGICTRLLNELINEAKMMKLAYLHLHSSQEGIDIYWRSGFIQPEQVELGLKLK